MTLWNWSYFFAFLIATLIIKKENYFFSFFTNCQSYFDCISVTGSMQNTYLIRTRKVLPMLTNGLDCFWALCDMDSCCLFSWVHETNVKSLFHFMTTCLSAMKHHQSNLDCQHYLPKPCDQKLENNMDKQMK